MTDRSAPAAFDQLPQEASRHGGDCHAEWKRGGGRTGEGEDPPFRLNEVRARLSERKGPEYWRGLEELAESEEFTELLNREFPRFAAEWPQGVSRRSFLHLAGASLGLAGLSACTRQPLERIVPYVRQPEEIVPGLPLHFASAVTRGGVGLPVLVESHDGRPTKLEGNPDHPASQGATDAITQAEILTLYDPDRSQSVREAGVVSSLERLLTALNAALAAERPGGGSGLRLLTGPVTSPSEAALIAKLREDYPALTWHRWDPLRPDREATGLLRVFGSARVARFDLARADVVVSFGRSFLEEGPASVRYARDFAARRKVTPERPDMNRLYVAEPSPSLAGAVADHRLAVRASRLPRLLVALAGELGAGPAGLEGLSPGERNFVLAAARDLQEHRGRGLILVGEMLPPEAHALAALLHERLGSVGATVRYESHPEADPVDGMASLSSLVKALREGQVKVLVMSGVNPAYDAPASLEFAQALQGSGALRIHHGLFFDETAELCDWHLPAAHDLERWGDVRAADGSILLLQPLIEPLYGGTSSSELWSAMLGQAGTTSYDLLRNHWKSEWGEDGFDERFRRAVHDGWIADSSPQSEPPTSSPGALEAALAGLASSAGATDMELVLQPDACVLDGRYANNGWLQELPKPITKLTWSNAALLSPRTAERLGVHNEDLLELRVGNRSLVLPAWILPGQADETLLVHLGYGRKRAGRVGDGRGVSAYELQSSEARWVVPDLAVRKAGGRRALACTQGHYAIRGWLEEETREAERRHVVRQGTLAEYRQDPAFAAKYEHEGLDTNRSLMPGFDYSGQPAWGMVIDLSACTGCNACVVACQAENNIPVVGEEQVRRGREMHWIRIDRYFRGSIDEPEGIVHQPIVCMQCEQAPCELVCPVAATVHSDDGLNDMVYNRCVGTRYCANNCPYKVRRFNFLLYADWDTPQFKLQRNPEVTVRSRGVMEKCTYCVQRIRRTQQEAKVAGRTVADGEIQTACQQACPAKAISFGDLHEAGSQVARLRQDPRNYVLLGELGTRPRTSYLALVKNPNPEAEA